MKSKIVICLIVLLCSGCATQPAQAPVTTLSNLKPGHGILLASYSRADPDEKFDTEQVEFRNVAGGKRYTIGINKLPLVPLKYDFQDQKSAGMIYVVALPEGKYEINGFAVTYTSWATQITNFPETKFSIPFEVKSGTINYLGEILIDRIYGPSFLGSRNQDSVHFDISDQEARDIALFKAKYPEVSMAVVNVVPAPELTNAYFRIIGKGENTQSEDAE